VGDIFNEDFREFIYCLNEANDEYMLVGCYATIIYGYNRTTGDLDIWVNQTEENYNRLVKAYQKFNMPLFDMSKNKFLHDPGIDVFTIGRPPVSIDIMTKLKGLNFEEVYQNVEIREIENDLNVKVIHLNDLVKAKKAANRPKDQDDIDHLT